PRQNMQSTAITDADHRLAAGTPLPEPRVVRHVHFSPPDQRSQSQQGDYREAEVMVRNRGPMLSIQWDENAFWNRAFTPMHTATRKSARQIGSTRYSNNRPQENAHSFSSGSPSRLKPGLSGRYRTRGRSPILAGNGRVFSYSPWYSVPSTE